MTDMRKIDRTRIPFARDGYGIVRSLLLTEIESPHVLIAGGSQSGKTTLLRLVAALAAGMGMIVIVVDPKRRWKGVFHRLPHVLVFDNPGEYLLALAAVVREMDRRYTISEQHQALYGTDCIGDRTRFPGVLVIGDEMPSLLITIKLWWARYKKQWTEQFGEPGEKPANEAPFLTDWQDVLLKGAEAGIVALCGTQAPNAFVFPFGTVSRGGYGQRVVLGVPREARFFSMAMGEERTVPVREGVQGSGVFFQDGTFHSVQVLYPEQASLAPMASRGVEFLREHGHLSGERLALLDDPAVAFPRPRPVLTGRSGDRYSAPVPLVRPGQMPTIVRGTGPDTPSSSAGPADTDPAPAVTSEETAEEAGDDREPRAGTAGDTGETARPGHAVLGFGAAAEYLNETFAERYTAESLRKAIRRSGARHPGVGKQGGSFVFPVGDLCAWYRAAHEK